MLYLLTVVVLVAVLVLVRVYVVLRTGTNLRPGAPNLRPGGRVSVLVVAGSGKRLPASRHVTASG